ncbi:hypothetical protein Kfla_7023 [Kribbella flavida DSM 17836]|uniref:Uncharacterized protein n=1 Tax=Kribbella flavida (strain DSM 17836 / JCM 10339 / NBRC 14399) TaxID=479435 RepID=D2Q3Y9_KRIFD|nr:hypothetical protein [Kribbella flavida]ADB36011.1 hypothetical protein Kfla_7023 [Kribbella flavida DSM 17836]
MGTTEPQDTAPQTVAARTGEPHGDRLARTEWLIAELRERADSCVDPAERTNLHRSADALVRLAIAMQP